MKGYVIQRKLVGGCYTWNVVCGSKDVRWLKTV
jgi:hypothetical protein